MRGFPSTGRDDPIFMMRIITADKSCVNSYDPETNSSLHTGRPAVSKIEESTSSQEHNQEHFGGFIWHSPGCATTQGQIVKTKRHSEASEEKHLAEVMSFSSPTRQRAHSKWKHVSLTLNNTVVAHQPSYTPDLATCKWFWFPKMECGL